MLQDGESTKASRLLDDDEVCVCMLAVDEATTLNGCAEISSGQHNRGWLGLNVPEEEKPKDAVDAQSLPWISIEMAPGDVLIYGNLMPHKSGANK